MKTETERASSNTSRSSSPEIIPGDRPQQGLNGQDSCYRRYRTAFTRLVALANGKSAELPLVSVFFHNLERVLNLFILATNWQHWKKNSTKKIMFLAIDAVNWQPSWIYLKELSRYVFSIYICPTGFHSADRRWFEFLWLQMSFFIWGCEFRVSNCRYIHVKANHCCKWCSVSGLKSNRDSKLFWRSCL